MALKCENPAIEILQPRAGIVFPDGGSTTAPFECKGAPMGIKNPEPIKGVTEWIRKPNAPLAQDPKTYFAKNNYDEINLLTENILGPDSETTLRYNGILFHHKFTACHRSLYGSPELEVSMFFMNDDGAMFHICIPIEYTNEAKGENLYLKKWLTTDTTIPNGLTTNELFNFHSEDRLKCAVLQHCLEYNGGKSKAVYLFCSFQNTLKVNQQTLQNWLKKDMYFSSPTEMKNGAYRHVVFDEILCLVLRGTFSKYVMDIADPYVISDERFFNAKRKQDEVQPTYYNLHKKAFLFQKVKEQFRGSSVEGFTSTRTLGNVKCYPIDLASQVDDNGNIVIDETTNKPIDPKEATVEASELNMDMDIDIESQKRREHTIAYWIFWILLSIIFVTVIAVSAVYILQGKTVAAPVLSPQVAITP